MNNVFAINHPDGAVESLTVAETHETNDPDCLIAITAEAGAVAVCRRDLPKAYAALAALDVPVIAYEAP